jgi:hypothetical protein
MATNVATYTYKLDEVGVHDRGNVTSLHINAHHLNLETHQDTQRRDESRKRSSSPSVHTVHTR